MKIDLSDKFNKKAKEIGELVSEKNLAYGNSFNTAGVILFALYPDGIKTTQYQDMLAVIRIVDKLYRIANKKNEADQMGESPYNDIAGYGILGAVRNEMLLKDEK